MNVMFEGIQNRTKYKEFTIGNTLNEMQDSSFLCVFMEFLLN